MSTRILSILLTLFLAHETLADEVAIPAPIAHWKLDDPGREARDAVGAHRRMNFNLRDGRQAERRERLPMIGAKYEEP